MRTAHLEETDFLSIDPLAGPLGLTEVVNDGAELLLIAVSESVRQELPAVRLWHTPLHADGHCAHIRPAVSDHHILRFNIDRRLVDDILNQHPDTSAYGA
ncbi:hypothetical protein [Streptosporangium sp. CA-115845]|uniref:hypothetical protein n=1 Tax=Streptosporangium sp. CA-115845 TaxID=3240071 RepID=UPI003D92C9CB